MPGLGTRVLTVAASLGVDSAALRLALLAVPVALLFTWIGRAYAPPLGETAPRRFAFGLLLLSGALILVDVVRAFV